MKKNYTKIIMILDRSGSMEEIASDVIGGYNTFIEDQRKLPGTCDISLYKFNHEYDVVYENTDINMVSKLTTDVFRPMGNTALLDAVGQTIDNVGKTLSQLAEADRPEKVLIVIITDGEENNSTKYSAEQVRKMIELQSNTYKWEFTYIGANQDAWKVGANLGIKIAANLTFVANKKGTTELFKSLSKGTTNYRCATSDAIFCYDANDIKAQNDAGLKN